MCPYRWETGLERGSFKLSVCLVLVTSRDAWEVRSLAARSTGSLGEGMGPRGMKQGAHSYRCGGLEVPGSLFNRAGTLGIVHMHSHTELNAMDANSVLR